MTLIFFRHFPPICFTNASSWLLIEKGWYRCKDCTCLRKAKLTYLTSCCCIPKLQSLNTHAVSERIMFLISLLSFHSIWFLETCWWNESFSCFTSLKFYICLGYWTVYSWSTQKIVCIFLFLIYFLSGSNYCNWSLPRSYQTLPKHTLWLRGGSLDLEGPAGEIQHGTKLLRCIVIKAAQILKPCSITELILVLQKKKMLLKTADIWEREKKRMS